MLPYVAFLFAVVFLILKLSGALDSFTEFMRQRNEDHVEVDEEMDKRLEVFRDFLETPSEEEH